MILPIEIYNIIFEYANVRCLCCRKLIKNNDLERTLFFKPNHWCFNNLYTIYFCNKECCDLFTNSESFI